MASQQLLVALLREKQDLAILKQQGWYRIPVEHAPERWPPQYLAFYQPSVFGTDAFRIRYFGRVAEIRTATRRELFPNEFESGRSARLYYRIKLQGLQERQVPIPSRFPRRVVFVSTTLAKFQGAEELNDLYDESPLEDDLWRSLKAAGIPAERQFEMPLQDTVYELDFAMFCNEGQIDVEADGDTWHAQPARIGKDNERNNALAAAGWQVLRFNGAQIHEDRGAFCISQIEKTINKLGGLSSDGVVPRKFYPDDDSQQLSLF